MKLVVKAVGNCTSQAKWQNHTCSRNTQRHAPVARKESHIRFQSHEEQEEDQTQVCNDIEGWDTGRGKDGIGEAWDMAHHRGAQDDATDDLCDNSRLTDL